MFCSLILPSCTSSTDVKPRKADILNKTVKLDDVVLNAEQDYVRVEYDIRKTQQDATTDQYRKQAAKLRNRLQDLYDKRRAFIADLIKSANNSNLADFNEIVLAVFLYEFRTHRVAGYAERSWTRAEKRERKRCPDIVTDGVLNQWALGLAKARPALYADALARLVQGMECYSMAEALSFSRALVKAYRDTLQQFADNKKLLSQAKAYLLFATANLFIVVQDLTKAYGPTPMYQLLRNNRRALGDLFMDRYSPVQVAGYWLYDMRLDRMVAVGSLCESLRYKKIGKSDNCVSATATLDALLDPMRLGLASCLLTDMISPVFDEKLGYLCQREVCSDADDNKPATRVALERKKTAYGVQLDDLRDARECPEGLQGSGANAGTVGLLGNAESFMQCITETLLAEQRGQQACFVAVSGQAGAAHYGFAPPPTDHENCSDPLMRRGDKKLRDKIIEAFHKAFEQFTEDEKGLLDLLLVAIGDDELTDDANECPKICMRSDENGTYTFTYNRNYVRDASKDDLKESTQGLLQQIINNETPDVPEPPSPTTADAEDNEEDDDFFCWAWEDNCPPDADGNDGGDEYCSPEIADCNNCSALSGLQQASLDCFITNEEAIPRRPGLPEQIMPLPWNNPDSPAWTACLEQQQGPDETLICGKSDCAEGEEPGLDANGQCICRAPAVPVADEPEPIDCPPGSFPVVGAGGVLLCGSPGSVGYVASD